MIIQKRLAKSSSVLTVSTISASLFSSINIFQRSSIQINEQWSFHYGLKILVPGMIVGRDIITTAGHKLVPQGTVLEASHIQRIRNHHSHNPLLGGVHIMRTWTK
jgi:hypothetical protein